MCKSLKIKKNEKSVLKVNYFLIEVRFYMGYSEYCDISIETSSEAEALTIANDLVKLENWFMESSLENLIESSLLKECLKEDAFGCNDENTELRFDNNAIAIVWIDDKGDQCSVELMS